MKRQPDKAEVLFDKMSKIERLDPDIEIYHTMMRAYALRHDVEGAIRYLELSESKGLRPTKEMFDIIIKRLGKSGDFWNVNLWIRRMEESGVERDPLSSSQSSFFFFGGSESVIAQQGKGKDNVAKAERKTDLKSFYNLHKKV